MIVSSLYVNTLLGDVPIETDNNSTISSNLTSNLTDLANNSSISDQDDETGKV